MRSRSSAAVLVGLGLLTATSCAPLSFTFHEEGSSGAGGASSSASSASSSSSSSSSSSASSGQGGAGGTGPVSVCGDGTPTPPEACDDGNTQDGDGCSSDCRCGDPNFAVSAFSLPNGGCYVLFATQVTWIGGRDYCAAKGWHLATVDTAAERDLISQAAQMVAVSVFWLGGTDVDVEGVWTWTDGSPWLISPCAGGTLGCDNAVDLWAPGEPNDMLGEDCLTLNANVGGFNDLSCQDMMYPLCEL